MVSVGATDGVDCVSTGARADFTAVVCSVSFAFTVVEVLEHSLRPQDVGTRVYTFVYTMANCLRGAARVGLPVIVCDRPNPIGLPLMYSPGVPGGATGGGTWSKKPSFSS